MAIYKVSYVTVDHNNPGSIMNQDRMPQKGDHIWLRNDEFEVIEVLELVPPRGEFHYIHASCRRIAKTRTRKKK